MMLRTSLLTILSLFAVSHIQAADLRGNLAGISGAIVNVHCGQLHRDIAISATGSFYITGLPANQACHFTVSSGNAISVRIPFNTRQNVTDYNGSLQIINNRIIVVRQ